MKILLIRFCIFVCLSWACISQAAEPPVPPNGDDVPRVSTLPNLASPTLGGNQFWTDELVLRGWRIQRYSVSGHCRLLDDNNVRLAWGTFESCQQRLNEIRREKNIAPYRGKVVVLLHGLGATRHSMDGLAAYLEKEGKYEVANVSYASTRAELARHSDALAKVIAGFGKDVYEINIVAHSLGNLVTRKYLTDPDNPGQPAKIDPRLRRIVMLGPPNNGAQWGARFKDMIIFEPVVGKSATQASGTADDLAKLLATPPCEFAIIAGGQGNGRGLNPFINGDDDFVIAVEETKLAGARDFTVVPVLHRWLMDDETVRQYTLRFLQHGFFVSDAARRPLP